VIIKEEEYLAHYGTPRHSGRYPWGSGNKDDPGAGARSFLGQVAGLRKQGMNDTDIAKGFGMTTTEFRNISSIAKNEKRQADFDMATRLKDKGYGNVEIGKRMGGLNESSVRALLAPGVQDRLNVLSATSGMLQKHVDEKRYVDVGSGSEYQLGVSREKLNSAVTLLKDKGYKLYYVKVPQVAGTGDTTIKVLAHPDVTYSELYKNRADIQQINSFSQDGGRTYFTMKPPLSIDSKRVAVRYAEEGGKDADGVIFVRQGVKDVTLDGSPYAQVRIAVDGTHYLKGMAMYKDDLPPGVDLVFNTNKSNTGNKLDAMKPMKTKSDGSIDQENPFSSSIKRQVMEKDSKGNDKVTSVMNILNEEGDWTKWSRNLSSQFLSKQSPTLAKEQLNMKFESKKAELDSIKQLTNPAVRRILLDKFADGADSSAVHLKAAALPRQGTHVILPMSTLKENEIYAPNFNNGDRVVLIRHPHAGVFEIPELTVNNKHPDAKSALGDAEDAIAIHPKVAEKLSGADFDGDTVLVIPNNQGKIKTAPSLVGLKDFDPQRAYPEYDGMKRMTPRQTQTEMGMISNLITDMTIQRAGSDDLARAVRHSMVVIDAEKHGLDFRASARDNGIAALRQKYQPNINGDSRGGAATLISRAGGEIQVADRRPRKVKDGGPIDKVTGEKKFEPTGKNYVNAAGKTVFNSFKSQKLAETSDANTLLSKDGGTTIERLYADHSNKLKDLANQARLASIRTESIPQSKSAKLAYANEVKSLDDKLRTALRNAPRERQAQLVANSIIATEKAKDPLMSGPELKKLKSRALLVARQRTGAGKDAIDITPDEWNAIQAGALSNHKLTQILQNSKLDKIKELATPREALDMTPTKKARAQSMIAQGYLQGEIAAALGVSVSTLRAGLKGGE
jgi:hypothetical protein